MASEWDRKFYDPQEIEGTVILPMPCGGGMAFRVVKTGTLKPLEDRAVVLGGNDENSQPYAEYSTPNYISGGFTGQDKKGERYFLMGKYEVTTDQYNAVINGDCSIPPNMKGRIPISNVSWFDAIQFSHKYSEWLAQNAIDKLPKEEGAVGFIRLPTNTEWEFAVRGGAELSEAEFRQKTYPVPDGLAKSVWFSGSKSSNGRINPTGNLAPNPLGLFDMLGNVSEMMFDPFKMNKLDRYHGQSGGITVRGGSYLTSEDQISSSFRIEQPYYNENGQAWKSKDTGFRVVLATPVITSEARIKLLVEEWAKLGKDGASKDKEIVMNLEQITNKVEDEKLKAQLKTLEGELRAANQAKEEQRNNAIQSSLRLGGYLCANIVEQAIRAEQLQKREAVFCEDKNTTDCKDLQAKISEHKKVYDYMLNYYVTTVVTNAQNYAQAMISSQIIPLTNQLDNQKLMLSPYVNQFWTHLQGYYKNNQSKPEEWLKSCRAVAEKQ